MWLCDDHNHVYRKPKNSNSAIKVWLLKMLRAHRYSYTSRLKSEDGAEVAPPLPSSSSPSPRRTITTKIVTKFVKRFVFKIHFLKFILISPFSFFPSFSAALSRSSRCWSLSIVRSIARSHGCTLPLCIHVIIRENFSTPMFHSFLRCFC